MPIIRSLASRDIDHIIGIVEGLPEWFTDNARTSIIRDALRAPGFVIEDEGVIQGFIILEERESCYEILWLAVERNHHGKRYGTLLLRKAEEYACSKGKHILTVKTYGGGDYEPYIRTLNFYKSRGFKEYETIDQYKPFGGQPATILVKPLEC